MDPILTSIFRAFNLRQKKLSLYTIRQGFFFPKILIIYLETVLVGRICLDDQPTCGQVVAGRIHPANDFLSNIIENIKI